MDEEFINSKWWNTIPKRIAKQQIRWERYQSIVRARECGLTHRQIAEHFGLSITRVHQLSTQSRSWDRMSKTPPVVKYFNEQYDIRRMASRLILQGEETGEMERIVFRLIQMQCCGQLLCWVNPRLPMYCSECGDRCYPEVRSWVTLRDENAKLIVHRKE